MSVLIGHTDKRKKNIEVDVLHVTNHPDYDVDNFDNDISVLELTRSIDLASNPQIKPVCLPYKSQLSDFVGKMEITTGWGDLSGNINTTLRVYPDLLQEAKLKVLGKENCGAGMTGMKEFQYCAGFLEGEKGTCFGDSGGPHVVTDPNNNNALTLIGVTSFGRILYKNGSSIREEDICAGEGNPGVIADVTYYMKNNWLMEQLPNLNTCPPPGGEGTYTPPLTTATKKPPTNRFFLISM